jgi:hypothetical protein
MVEYETLCEMKNIDVQKLRSDIIQGMKISSQKLKASKKLLGRNMIISENGKIREIVAKELK